MILFGGRVIAEKGLRQLIEALASVRGNWRLIVAGDGPGRAGCEQLAEHLGINQHIEFAGWVEPAQMTALYRHCTFAVMPSLWPEPYGRIGPEAFVHGRPAIAFSVGGIPDWLDDGETGYLVAPGNVAELSTAIARLLEKPDEQERMGRTARERARVHWNAETHVQVLLAAFQAAIRGFR
jgi:glycosyltransferase involved in cell wall biosynthesis